MTPFESELARRLGELKEQALLRQLRRVTAPQQTRIVVDGRALLNFSSNDYLGLATHPKLKAKAAEAIEKYGVGSGASRLVCGSLEPHHELEEALAAFKKTQAALTFSSGYATALGTVTALVSRSDIIVLDKLIHASLVDAARLSGATLRVFRHNDLADLEAILQWADRQRANSGETRILIVTESLFSMDGDVAPLREIVALKERYGAWLFVDEAHATGLFGANRRGLAEECGLADRIEVQMGTLGKALGSAGGYIAGSRTLVDYLVNKARSFIFSTAPPPSASAAGMAALGIVSSPEGAALVQRLRSNIELFGSTNMPIGSAANSPIVPLLVGDETRALELAASLRDKGLFVPAIRYPTVSRGKARLRFTFSSAHTPEEVQFLKRIIGEAIT